VKQEGASLTKTFYDGLGRVTHSFVLAEDDDTVYVDADDVTGDIVLVEDQTTYDSSSGKVLMRARIDRLHDDRGPGETTGALDTNADGDALKYTAANVKGRIQITGTWYDSLDRQVDQVAFGTYGGSDFDRDGMSAPARSDTALRTTYGYATDGTVQDVTDPRALVRRTSYDDAGRVTSEIRNYGDGTPSGTDSDVTVSYTYTDGLRTKITADLPAGSTDQETLYIYGTTNGTPSASEITTGHLLRAVVYPDSTNAGTTESAINTDDSDVVSFAYDAQGREVLRKDQAGNIVETDLDGSGRLTQKRVTTLAGGFDGAVRRIATAYDGLGRRQTVTQYDNAAVGSGTVQDEVKLTYDGWGNLEKLEQDRNSAVGAGGSVDDYEVSYTYAKATAGRNTVRRTGITLPSSASVSYDYRSVAGRHDDDVSRVTTLTTGAVVVASYQYNGLGQVVEQDYNEIEVMWRQFGSTSGTYPDLDRFNRVTSSRWTKDLATDVDFYDVDITYDRNSNITLVADNVHSGFDVSYSIDDIDRLTRAEEGTWNGSSITSRSRDQQWTLDHAGNWDEDKLDLNGDLNYTDTDEWHDCRTHNDVNELTGRDLDCTPGTGGDNYTLSYDAAGNMTDDAKDYKYEYDAFNRLRKVKNQSDALVEENRYNGLGFRIAEHVDTDDDNDVDANDAWRYFAYDERWRILAHFIDTDTDPIEQYLPHNAGLDGMGGSLYIDLVVLRERDTDANGSLDERLYYCQNWRADVSALIERLAGPSSQLTEWAKYSAYGVPFGLPGGDADSDGDCDVTDVTQIQTWIDGSSYDVRGDIDLNGTVDSTDKSTVQNAFQGTTLGRGVLSAVVNRQGLAGYEHDASIVSQYHVRYRMHEAPFGRWAQRDPLGYVDGFNLYEYVNSRPTTHIDPAGLDEISVIWNMPGGAEIRCEADAHVRCVGDEWLECNAGLPICYINNPWIYLWYGFTWEVMDTGSEEWTEECAGEQPCERCCIEITADVVAYPVHGALAYPIPLKTYHLDYATCSQCCPKDCYHIGDPVPSVTGAAPIPPGKPAVTSGGYPQPPPPPPPSQPWTFHPRPKPLAPVTGIPYGGFWLGHGTHY